MEKQLKTVLENVERKIPFNSFGNFLLHAGIKYPETLGGNCVLQARELGSVNINNNV